jgi:hypothetical protein
MTPALNAQKKTAGPFGGPRLDSLDALEVLAAQPPMREMRIRRGLDVAARHDAGRDARLKLEEVDSHWIHIGTIEIEYKMFPDIGQTRTRNADQRHL